MNGESYYDVLELWMVKPFELILHGEVHRLSGTDYDKRLSLISFDNSIEVSIKAYLSLSSSAEKYDRKTINNWLENFKGKINFLEYYLKNEDNYQKDDIEELKKELHWLHSERNKQYHEPSACVPDGNTLEKIREKAILVFSILFGISVRDVEDLLKSALLQLQTTQNPFEVQKKYIFSSLQAPKEFLFSKTKTFLKSYENSLFLAAIFGEWSERYRGDMEAIREVVSQFMNFEDWMNDLREIRKYDSDMIVVKNGHWKVSNKNEILSTYTSFFYDQHLAVIKSVSIKVLSEKDRIFESTLEDKSVSLVSGIIPKYSQELKEGLCETIAFIGVNASYLNNCSSNVPGSIVSSILREVLKTDDWKIWADLNNLLPLLAEADPDEFLSIVEDILYKPSGAFAAFFSQDKNQFRELESYMFGLYQSLEILAWSKDYLQRSLIALAGLAHLYPKERTDNHPLNSIVRILLPWMPQTTASLEEKISAVNAMAKYYPDVAFKVLIQLLPSMYQSTIEHRKPMFRNYIPIDWKKQPTREEYIREVEEYSLTAVEKAKENPEYIKELIKEITSVPPKAFDNLITYLSSSNDFVTDEEKEPIWRAILYTVAKNKRFSNASWALSPEKIELLEQLEIKFAPSDPNLSYRHLFSSEDLGYLYSGFGKEKENETLENRRVEALKEIYKIGSAESILKFARSVEKPYEVGYFFARISNKEDDRKLLPSYLSTNYEPDQKFITGYIEGCYFSKGFQWIYSLNVSDWSVDERLNLFLKLPFESEVWNNLKKFLGEKSEDYWRKVVANPYRTRSDLLIAVKNLLKYDRPLLAFLCIHAHYIRTGKLLKEEAIDALLKMDVSQEDNYFVSDYDIVGIIKVLQSDKEVSEETLFEIEWKHLPLLNGYYEAEPKLVMERLSTDPDFFVKVIRLSYPPNGQAEEGYEYSEERIDDKRIMAMRNLLNMWKTVPGMTKDGSFYVSAFKQWLDRVSDEARKSGRFELAMFHVGRVLLYTPPDPSGLWINLEVADILDKPENEQIREGYFSEIFDSEGVREYDFSGKYEREKAELWQNRANEMKKRGFTFFARTLEGVASQYELEGNTEKYD